MKRRTLLKSLAATTLVVGTGVPAWMLQRQERPIRVQDTEVHIRHDPEILQISGTENKTRQFDLDYDDDLYLATDKQIILQSIVARLSRLQRHIGHANFSLLSFDRMLKYAKQYTVIGAFTQMEKEFLEEMFSNDAIDYGFMGNKVTTRLTESIKRKDTIKIPRSGNYLFRGESLKMYQQVKKDVGVNLLLTSGIRSIVKQMYLFLAKLIEADGNLSRASRSLAPPGHSYHGVGDFDVGQTGLGHDNFTARFAKSEAFNKLKTLAYIDIRYTADNQYGVRYEPWHIKVVS